MHEDWGKYQFYQYELIKEILKNNSSSSLKTDLAVALNNLGYLARRKGKITDALDYYGKSLKIHEEVNNKSGVAGTLNNMGAIYKKQGQTEEALQFYERSLKIKKEINDSLGIAESMGNIGSIYIEQGKLDEALTIFLSSLEIQKRFHDKKSMAISLSNIGNIYRINREYAKALEYYEECLSIQEEIGYKMGVSIIHNNLGNTYLGLGDEDKALYHFNKSLSIAEEIGIPQNIKSSAKSLSALYEKQGKGMKALEMFKLFIYMRDSISNIKTQKTALKQQAKYEYEKQKALDDAAHEKQLAIQKEEKEKQRLIIIIVGGGLLIVSFLLIVIFNRLRITRNQKLVIENQKKVLESAHKELGQKNSEIMDSISYAKRIQSAILPSNKLVQNLLKDSFILYKPKDVVAGDFYWFEEKGDAILFAAADCTGHGVPGAMVSVVCNNALNRSVREYDIHDPGQILDKTREIVTQEFEKSEEDVKDGMDIALCSIKNNRILFAGANNPLWIIRNNEVLETKANKQPIGKFDNPEPYTTHTIDLQPGDTVYVFSDGYVDQFGGEKGKKFKPRPFRELLVSIQDKSMTDQKLIIDDSFESWRGDLEQVDDVCIIGVRI